MIRKLLDKIKKKGQDWTQSGAVKCHSVCMTNPENQSQGFFCYHAFKYDITYPILFFGIRSPFNSAIFIPLR